MAVQAESRLAYGLALSRIDQGQQNKGDDSQLFYICGAPSLLDGEGDHGADDVGPVRSPRAWGCVSGLGHESILWVTVVR